MKNIIKKLTLTVTISLTLLVGCSDFFDKIDDFNVGVTNAIFEQSAVIELQDYFGNQQDVVDADLKVEFSGADADKLVNEAGETKLTETDGFIQLNVNPNKSTGVKELNFNITVSGGNYRTETFPVTLTDTISLIQLKLLDKDRFRFSGIDNVSKTATLSANTLNTEITLATSKTNAIRKSTVNIKTGTQFKDKQGNILTGNQLNVFLETTDANGISQYLSEYTYKDESGETITKPAKFYSGNVEITMDVNGVDVKEFTNPIAVSIEIPATANNPFTNEVVKIGDTLPVYTNEEDSQEWTYHGLGTLVAGETSETLTINFETTHLSSYSIIEFEETGCSEILDFNYNITAENLPADFDGTVNIVAGYSYKPNSGEILTGNFNLFEISIKNGKINSIKNSIERAQRSNIGSFWEGIASSLVNSINTLLVSSIKQAINSSKPKGTYYLNSEIFFDYEIYFTLNGAKLNNDFTKVSSFVDCNLGVNLTSGLSLPNQKTIAVGLAGKCGEKNFIPDGFPIYVERANGTFSYEGVIKKGFVFLRGFELGKQYNFKTFYKGKSYFYKWTFESTTFFDFNYPIPDGACDLIP